MKWKSLRWRSVVIEGWGKIKEINRYKGVVNGRTYSSFLLINIHIIKGDVKIGCRLGGKIMTIIVVKLRLWKVMLGRTKDVLVGWHWAWINWPRSRAETWISLYPSNIFFFTFWDFILPIKEHFVWMFSLPKWCLHNKLTLHKWRLHLKTTLQFEKH